MVALTSSVKKKYENILVEADNRVSYMNYSNRQFLSKKLSGVNSNKLNKIIMKKYNKRKTIASSVLNFNQLNISSLRTVSKVPHALGANRASTYSNTHSTSEVQLPLNAVDHIGVDHKFKTIHATSQPDFLENL